MGRQSRFCSWGSSASETDSACSLNTDHGPSCLCWGSGTGGSGTREVADKGHSLRYPCYVAGLAAAWASPVAVWR